MTKKMLLPATLALGLILVALVSVSSAYAQDLNDYPTIVQKLAEKFNLNEADVQAVFDDNREEHYANMQANWSERLDDLVNDGKISAGQKQAILDKHEEMHDKMLEYKDLEPDERRMKMQELHDDLKTWSQENGINIPLMGPMGRGFRQGFRAGHMMAD